MSDSPATIVVTAVPNPTEMESVQEYLKGVMPLFMAAGGQLVKRLSVNESLLGRPAGMVMVMDFDSTDAVKDLFESEDYRALIPARDRGFTETNILLTQSM